MNKGILCALGAYITWGLFPIYWKWLQPVPAIELIGHRIVWSCAILCVGILAAGQWRQFKKTAFRWNILPIYSTAGLLIGFNWLVYVWAVNAGFIVETSLGYFINPLVNVLLGVLVLGERLRAGQWIAISLAACGVLYLTVSYGALPWIALTLALTFGLYGLLKKMSPLGAVHGLTIETFLLLLPALVYLLYLEGEGAAAFGHSAALTSLLLIGAGIVTTIPLLLFAGAARRIPLSILGLFQYIAPTLQFLIGVLLYREPFTSTQFVGFGIVWTALAISAVEGLLARR